MRAVGPKNKKASATGQVPATGNGQKASREERNSANNVSSSTGSEAVGGRDGKGEGSEGEMGWDAHEFLWGLHVWQLETRGSHATGGLVAQLVRACGYYL